MRWRVARASRCAIVGLVVAVVAEKPNRNETKLIFYDTNALLVVVVVEIHELGEIAEIFARGRLRGAVRGGFDVERDGVSRQRRASRRARAARAMASRAAAAAAAACSLASASFSNSISLASRARGGPMSQLSLRRLISAGRECRDDWRVFAADVYSPPTPRRGRP